MKKSETKTATNNGASNAVAANAAAAAAAAAAEVEPTKAELEAEFDPNDKGKWKLSGSNQKIEATDGNPMLDWTANIWFTQVSAL